MGGAGQCAEREIRNRIEKFLQASSVGEAHAECISTLDIAYLDGVEAVASLEKHLDDPNTFVLSHVYIQAWGRKP